MTMAAQVPSDQHFWDEFYGWSLGLGAFITLVVIIIIAVLIDDGAFTWVTRLILERQRHRHRVRELAERVKLAKLGVDPAYIAFLDKRIFEVNNDSKSGSEASE